MRIRILASVDLPSNRKFRLPNFQDSVDENQSYASISKKYGVSLQAVKKRAAREKWQDKGRKLYKK